MKARTQAMHEGERLVLQALANWPDATRGIFEAAGIDHVLTLDGRAIARWAAGPVGVPMPPNIREILVRDDGVHLPWVEALERGYPRDAQWAVDIMQRGLRLLGFDWIPDWLEWGATGLRSGDVTPERVAAEILPLLRLFIAEGGAE